MWTARPPRSSPISLALAGVDAAAQLDAELRDPLVQRLGAAHRHRRAVEGRQRPVADVLDDPPAVLGDDAVDERVVALEHLAPGTVAELCRARRRAHDVREQDARQHPVRLGATYGAGDEPLDLIDEPVDRARRHGRCLGT